MKKITPSHIDEPEATESFIKAHTFTPASQRQSVGKRRYQPILYVMASLLILALSVLWFIFTAKSLVITTLPISDNVQIQGGLHVQWGDNLLVTPGTYTVYASHKGYYPFEQSFLVDEQQNQLQKFVLKRLPGRLALDIKPDVVNSVYIDGELTELDQGVIESVAAGERTLTVKADNYFPFNANVIIEGKLQAQSLPVELIPAWGNVMLNSTPLGAEVYQEDLLLGATPLNVELIQGSHQLRFEKKGYRPSIREVNILAGQSAEFKSVTLFKAMGVMAITSEPSGVNISYGEQFLGVTPLSVSVNPKKQQELLLFKEGYQSQSHIINILPGQQVNKHFTLADDLGEIAFNVSPKGALLYLNDRLMGRAQTQLSLPIKQHNIRIESPGFESYQATILPQSDMEQRLDISLKTLEQAKFDNMQPMITADVGSQLKLFKPNDVIVMGASRREQGRRANEVKRKVQISRAFYLGVTEITNKQFRQFQRQHSSGHVNGNSLNGTHQPAVKLTWQQAALFCNWLSERDNLDKVYLIEDDKIVDFDNNANGYRLPTEAEWVWASRFQKGQMLKYSWGSTLPPTENSGNFADISGAPILGTVLTNYNDKYVATAPVASFTENMHGIFDLSGNVSEWLHDYYQIQTGLSQKTEQDPMGPKTGDYHVIRGSSWAHGSRTELRLSFRDYGNDKRNDLGFRLARNAL
jgi:formylglycine-generating enzyme required for sulfatase activity